MTKDEFDQYLHDNNINTDLRVTWSTGGCWGNCWNDELQQVVGDTPEELDAFDELLEFVKPDLSFIQYKRMAKVLVKSNESSEGDYYGGSSNYMTLSVDFGELHEYLKEKGWLPAAEDDNNN